MSANIESLKKKRNFVVSKINKSLDTVKILTSRDELDCLNYPVYKKQVEVELDKLEEINNKIIDLFIEVGLDDQDVIDSELEIQNELVSNIKLTLASHDTLFSASAPVPAMTSTQVEQPSESNNELKTLSDSLVTLVNKIKSSEDNRLPPLHCATFENNSKDKFEFKNFLEQFNNVIGHKDVSDSVKLSHLVGLLKGDARRLVSHLSISDSNFEVALELLKKEFLDIEAIVDQILEQVANKVLEPYDPGFAQTKQFISEVRALVSELANYDYLFLQEKSGNRVLSHLLFKKLPLVFRREIVHKVGSNYPNLNDIFTHYNDVINTLNLTTKFNNSPKRSISVKPKPTYVREVTPFKYKSKNLKPKEQTPTLQQFNVNTNPSKNNYSAFKRNETCKFCLSNDHSMSYCTKFSTLKERKLRADALSLCGLCGAVGHSTNSCAAKFGNLKFPCKFCKERTHIMAFCPSKFEKPDTSNINLCMLNSASTFKEYILPTITLNFVRW